MDYGGDWLRMDSNFDDIFQAILTMFKVSITEGWLQIMWHGIDSLGIDQVTKRDHNTYLACFFCFFILTATWFILNIFDNITIDNFIKEKDKSLGIENLTHK